MANMTINYFLDLPGAEGLALLSRYKELVVCGVVLSGGAQGDGKLWK